MHVLAWTQWSITATSVFRASQPAHSLMDFMLLSDIAAAGDAHHSVARAVHLRSVRLRFACYFCKRRRTFRIENLQYFDASVLLM